MVPCMRNPYNFLSACDYKDFKSGSICAASNRRMRLAKILEQAGAIFYEESKMKGRPSVRI